MNYKEVIHKTKPEMLSHLDRQRWAEGLILQLPNTHDGRNSWLLNYGVKSEAIALRNARGLHFDEHTQAAETAGSILTTNKK